MSAQLRDEVVSAEGPGAPPRRNGELVFEAPWQGRAFGMGVALCERGVFQWREFQRALIETIGARQGKRDPREYYEQWLDALGQLLVSKGVLSAAEIERRTQQFLSGEGTEDP